MPRTATCVWHADGRLLTLLDGRLGVPVDSFVNGTQTWLTDTGPGGVTLEWRLHPVGGFRPPAGLSHYDLWDAVLAALPDGDADEEPAGALLALGGERRALATLWDGLECFAAYGDELEPAPLAAAAAETISVAPDASGLVDHERIGDAWEASRGRLSLVELLLEELRAT